MSRRRLTDAFALALRALISSAANSSLHSIRAVGALGSRSSLSSSPPAGADFALRTLDARGSPDHLERDSVLLQIKQVSFCEHFFMVLSH